MTSSINTYSLENLSKIINQIDKIIKKEAYDKIGFSLFIWLLIFPFVIIAILIALGVYPGNFFTQWATSKEMANSLLQTIYQYYVLFPIIFVPLVILNVKKYLNQKNIYLKTTLNELEKEMKNIDNIEIIFTKLSTIQEIIETLLFKKFYIRFFLGKEVYLRYRELLGILFRFLLHLVSDLKSDLQININKTQDILEKSRTELSETIDENKRGEQVSELQKARLDRQIEQFEELERVLIKM